MQVKRLPTFAFYVLAALICVLSEGCHCHFTIGTKKSPKPPENAPAPPPAKKLVNKIKVDLPGRTAAMITDEAIYFTGGKLFTQAAIGKQTLKFTKEAIFWNNEEVVPFTPDLTELEIRILGKHLKISTGETVLFEADF